MIETLEHKCCIPGCTGNPASVMTAKKEEQTLSFYACKPHEKAVWNYALKKYKSEGYEMNLENITTGTE